MKRNRVRAYVWYKLAADNNNKEASDRLTNLTQELTAKQKAEAEALYKQWKPGQRGREYLEYLRGEPSI